MNTLDKIFFLPALKQKGKSKRIFIGNSTEIGDVSMKTEKFNERLAETQENQEKGAGTLVTELKSYEHQKSSPPRTPHKSEYKKNVVICEQPSTRSLDLPVSTLDWVSRSESYFMPATGLDFLIGVSEVLLLQATYDASSSSSSSDSKFLVKVPEGQTLYLGMENSSSVQKALFCSQRDFNMTFLDPTKHEAATFVRKSALTNVGTGFRQEMLISKKDNDSPIGRIVQENTFSEVSFAIFDDKNQQIFKILGSKNSTLGRLNADVHFSILNPVDRTGGVILHKWDSAHADPLYHIIFPSCDISVQNKMLLIGAALLVEYTYFKKTECFSCV